VTEVLSRCYQCGVVALRAGPYNNSLRFLLPLVIEPEDLEQGLEIVDSAFDALV
jgi:4-aminobutyrate aminotransferase / (S)-3-amino-2-methylpropionate transaminase / 5-aminovalerate transaminase